MRPLSFLRASASRGVESFFRRPLTESTFESRVALDGDVAFGEFIDYRGQPVFGVARRIGASGYSVARKVDRDEALAEHRRRAVLEQLVGALSFLLFGFVMVAQHRKAVAREFEERVAQQEALRERDRRYRVLFESAGDGIFLMRGSQFVDCNQKALELFGCGREQIIGNTPSAFSPPQQANGSDSQEAALERIRLALEGQNLRFEWQHLRLDGTPFDAEVALNRLEIAGEAHLLALVRDVTERKRAGEERQRSFEQLRALAGRLQSIREEERKGVAREIHDQLGQALTAVKIGLSSLIHDLPAGKRQGSESVLDLIDRTIQSVRRISTELRPMILDDLGLVAAVEWAGEEFEARTKTKCRMDLPPEDIFIDPERATALFRILQETLTNVARHASATQVNIRLAKEQGGLSLEIRDNGKGVSEEQLSDRQVAWDPGNAGASFAAGRRADY